MDDLDAGYNTPGQLINEILDAREWTQATLAIVLGINKATVNKILVGKQPIDAKMALTLGGLLDVSPERLMRIQQKYELGQARLIARPDPGLTTRAHLFGKLPISDMIKRGWINVDDMKDVPKVEAALARFFGVKSVDEIEILPHAAKKTKVAEEATPVQLAWIHRVKEIASGMLVDRYSQGAVRDAIPSLKALVSAPEEARKVPRILRECGIRYVLVESLPSAKIDGVCFWLDDRSPVVALSMRHDRIDNFWFVLRHEIEHVLRLHGRSEIMLDANLEGDRAGTGESVSEDERVANEAAAEFCIPKAKLEGFIARKDPFFTDRDILGFALTMHVHPGIVAGQLQRRTGRYDRFRSHLVKIRSFATQGAMVDGWGDVAPD